jgi:hypothetical protein
MDYTHVHLYLNHTPVVGSVILFVFLGHALLYKKPDLVKISLWFFLIIALIFIPVYLSGEPAEEVVEKQLGIAEEIVDKHEEAALISLIIVELIGVISIAGIFIYKKEKPVPAWFSYMLIVLNIAMIISFARTATLGGEIRHTEIRSGQ